ncbi:MAG: hypothetical protein M5U35_12835 [Roseovarius sp.]|nr:hypothetical protein [Roseovarius sp.]
MEREIQPLWLENEGEIDMEGREAFENELRAQLDEFIAIVGRMRAKVETEHGDLQMKLMAEVDNLAAYQRRAETYLQELREARGDAWKDMKSDFELAQGEIRQALDRAWKRIRIDPTAAAHSTGEDASDPEAFPHRSS